LAKKLLEAKNGEFKNEFSKSLGFWDSTIIAHHRAAIQHLCRLYDDHKDDERGNTFHLLRFVERIDVGRLTEKQREQRQHDNDFLQRETKDRRPNPMVANLREWRRKLIAHLDYDCAIDQPEKFISKHPLNFSDIESLAEQGFSILEKWAFCYHVNCDISRLASWKDDYLHVFESLRNDARV
jgi:hypothetical protein